MKEQITPFQEGQSLRPKRFNLMREILMRCGISVTPPLQMIPTSDGVLISYDGAYTIWAKITSGGTGGKYAWTQQIPVTGGGWADGALTGTTTVDYALEANTYTSVAANKIVPLRRESNTWIFTASTC